jgi:Ala-tRNA(Pro) deacylase
MVNPEEIYQEIIYLLDASKVKYKLFYHRAAFTYKELTEVQKEAGFFGTEGKCMVLKVKDNNFLVYITLHGKRLDFEAIKKYLNINKIQLASPDELKEYFGAEPGCAYPFGFDDKFNIYIDPEIYRQEWLLFSPVYPSKTIQIKGQELRKIFNMLENEIQEVTTFNQ